MADIFCFGEAGVFPEAQFSPDENGNLVHRVQPATDQHFAADGVLVRRRNQPIVFNMVVQRSMLGLEAIDGIGAEADHEAVPSTNGVRAWPAPTLTPTNQPTPPAVPDGWPPFPSTPADDAQWKDYLTALYTGQVKAVTDRLAADASLNADREKAAWTNEYALAQAVQQAYLDVTKAALDRARAGATFVQVAASAVATIYGALLALQFSVSANTPRALPPWGVGPALFLGLAIALAAVYLAYIQTNDRVPGPTPHAFLGAWQQERLEAFSRWTATAALLRASYLHASVVSLACGVAFLPLTYINFQSAPSAPWIIYAVAALVVAVVAFWPWLRDQVKKDRAQGNGGAAP